MGAQPVITLTFPNYLALHAVLMILGQVLAIAGAYLAQPQQIDIQTIPTRLG